MFRDCERQYTDECAPVTVEDFNGLDTSQNSQMKTFDYTKKMAVQNSG